ncbi:MAG: phycobiliprotein lyase [Leptolyngbya sp. DLM2.Bin15]|nr:MAG: phycobiliprotein lyase [Leptolyngbya sp. DLM2.Bin15]
MLSFSDFFIACAGTWTTERTYHYVLDGEVERSYTEFRAMPLGSADKQRLLSRFTPLDEQRAAAGRDRCPGFAVAFETRSETGEEVSMSLKALFVPDDVAQHYHLNSTPPHLPLASHYPKDQELIEGVYLRNEGYSETGAIAGRFTYQPTRQTLEMTTYYNRSVAVDQMRFVSPELRMRTIVTYERPVDGEVPTVIDLMGFGVERKSTTD